MNPQHAASRRRFIQRTSALGAGFAVGAIAGCGGGSSSEAVAQTASAAVPEPKAVLDTGVTLHYAERGTGQAVILLPGWTCNSWFFQYQLPALAAAGYRAIAIDPRGCGDSEKTLEGHSFTQRGKDVDALIRHLGLDAPILVGWSYGVYDMLAYVRDHASARIGGVVVVDEPPTSPGIAPNDAANPDAWSEIPDLPTQLAFARGVVDDRTQFWTDYARYMISATDANPQTALVAEIVAQGLKASQSVASQTILDGMASDFGPTLRALDGVVPTLVVAREDWAASARAWTTANVPGAQFTTMLNHMGFFLDPDSFNTRLLQFLRSIG